jgi:hypothetical protein
VRRQDADRQHPDENRTGDDEVDERLDDQGRGERRVRRALDALLQQVELDDVATTRRNDRIDPDARRVRAERIPVARRVLGIRGGDDVLPGAAAKQQLDEVARDRKAERRPPDIGEMVEEDVDRVPKSAQSAQGTSGVRQAPAATRIQSVPNPSSIPSRIIQAISLGAS